MGAKRARRIVLAKIALTGLIATVGSLLVYSSGSRIIDIVGLIIVALSPVISYLLVVTWAGR